METQEAQKRGLKLGKAYDFSQAVAFCSWELLLDLLGSERLDLALNKE